MSTTNAEFKKIIFETLEKGQGDPVVIERFYAASESGLSFDEQDLASTILKGEETGEPSWKRNLRNALQGMKNKGEVVNSSPSYWRMPTPDPATFIDPVDAWAVIVQRAGKAKTSGEVWNSPKKDQSYHVADVEENKIIIMRHGTNTLEPVYKNDIIHAFISLNAAGGGLGRRAMSNVVAKESAIVHLHPELLWDDTYDHILVIRSAVRTRLAVMKEIAEADNDGDIYQPSARRIRKGQPILRKKLLELYNEQCCVTRTGPVNVLQAAHIEPHSRTGNNHSTNALLLRSDIHDLFDDHLILIEPVTLKIFVHPDLKGTVYEELGGHELVARSDGSSPDHQKLSERWQEHYWSKARSVVR